jgi:hypothetical protein
MACVSGAVQAGYAPPTGPDQPARGRRWLRWLVAATVVWAVLLAGLTWHSVRDDPPTVREQRTLAEAAPVADRAVGRLVAAVGDAAWQLTPAEVGRDCRITPLSDGASLTRAVEVLVTPGGERALLERVAGRLPADWRAEVTGVRLRADAGEFVAVDGRVVADGVVRLTAGTGCRPNGGWTAPSPAGDAGPELAGALAALGRPATDPVAVTAACPGGGAARTVRVTAGAAPVPLTPLAPLGAAVVERPDRYAYRTGSVLVLADATGGQLRLAASTGCAG